MSTYFKNASNEEIDVFLVDVKKIPVLHESNGTLLNGEWFVQTIGTRAYKLAVQLTCSKDVLDEILEYAYTKEQLSISFIDGNQTGMILGDPSYEVYLKGTTPYYFVDFELAVI